MGNQSEFFLGLSRILKKDSRYKEESYWFVMAALGRAAHNLPKPRHVSGQELLESIRREAEEQFGPMAATVFEHWGLKNSLDFGHIVFSMVREDILFKEESDALEDFNQAGFFQNLFDKAEGYYLKEDMGHVSRTV